MAAATQVEINSKSIERLLKIGPGEAALSLKVASDRVAQRFLQYHKKNRLRGPPGLRSTRRGIEGQRRYEVSGKTLSNLLLHFFVRSRIAVEHEEGRTITPRHGGFLAIPTTFAGQDSRGRTKARARNLLRNTAFKFGTKGGEKSRRKTLFPLTIKGTTFLAAPNKGGLPILYFHLQAQAHLKPRLEFYKSWRAFRPQAMKIFGDSVRFAIKAMQRKAAASGGAVSP